MSRTVVISQPMFLPWHGLFEQIRFADVYMHYDDVLMPTSSSFINRVQVLQGSSIAWLTAPIENSSGKLIRDVKFAENIHWRKKHIKTLVQAYRGKEFGEDAVELIQKIYANSTHFLSEFNVHSIETLSEYLGISREFVSSSSHPSSSSSTERLLELVLALGGTTYLTGHGAKNYMNFGLFEEHGIQVDFIDYARDAWPQSRDAFTPYVTILDAIANAGRKSVEYMKSNQVGWKEFCNG